MQICRRTLLPIANSTLTFNLYEVYSFKRHIYQQKNSLLPLSPLYYNYPQPSLGDNLVLKLLLYKVLLKILMNTSVHDSVQ